MPKLQHIVLIKFKPETTSEQIQSAFDQILDLTETAEQIENYFGGENCSTEGLSHGYNHGFVMTFHDTAARDAYLQHSAHEQIKALLTPLVESVLVSDIEV